MDFTLSQQQRESIRRMIGHTKYVEIATQVGCTLDALRQYVKVYEDDPAYIAERQLQEAEEQRQDAERRRQVAEYQAHLEASRILQGEAEQARENGVLAKFRTVATPELDARIAELQRQKDELQEVVDIRRSRIKAKERREAVRKLAEEIADEVKREGCHNQDALIHKAVDDSDELWDERSRELHDESHEEQNGYCRFEGACFNWDEAITEAKNELWAELKEALDLLLGKLKAPTYAEYLAHPEEFLFDEQTAREWFGK